MADSVAIAASSPTRTGHRFRVQLRTHTAAGIPAELVFTDTMSGARDRAQAEVTRLQGEVTTVRAEAIGARDEKQAVGVERDQAREEASNAREALAREEGRREHAETEITRLRTELEAARQKIRDLEVAAPAKDSLWDSATG